MGFFLACFTTLYIIGASFISSSGLSIYEVYTDGGLFNGLSIFSPITSIIGFRVLTFTLSRFSEEFVLLQELILL